MPLNTAPTGQDSSLTVLEDGRLVIGFGDFGGADSDGTVTGVEITTLPTNGTLYIDTDGAGGSRGTAVTAGTTIAKAAFDAGQVVFVPTPNGTAAGSFTFRVQDDLGAYDDAANTVTLSVTAVNDAPTATIMGNGTVKIGGEFLVNTTIFQPQSAPKITSLAAGGFVVSWTDSSQQGVDTSGNSIKAQIFDAAGGKVGGDEFLVNTATAGAQTAATITALASGGFVVSWTDASTQGGDVNNTGIKAQIFDAAGGKVGGNEFLVNTTTAGAQTAATITALASGGFVVSWTDASTQGGDANSTGIKAQIFSATGGTVGGEFLVNTETTGAQTAPTITSLASGGFVVSWTDGSTLGTDTNGTGIKAQIFDAAGGKVGGEFLVNTAFSGNQNGPTITSLASGGFVVSWTDASVQGGDGNSTGIKAQVFDAAGGKVGGEFLVNSVTGGAQVAPTITSLASGGFVVSWTDNSRQGVDTSLSGIKAQLFDAAGAKVGTEFLVNTTTQNAQTAPTITALASGGFAIGWTDDSRVGDTSFTGIKAQLFDLRLTATEQTAFDLKGSLTVADIDAGTGAVTATLSANFGVLTVTAGTSGATVAGTGTGTVTLTGTIAQINALLRSDTTSAVSYLATSDAPPATATLTLAVDDGGNTGTGGALTGSASKTIFIASVNDAPSGADTTLALAEDGFRTLTTSDFGFVDVDGHGFQAVRITTAPSAGTLYYDVDGAGTGSVGSPLGAGSSVSAADIAAGRLVYVPAANGNGTGNASFTFQVQDDGGTANGGIDLDQSPNTVTFDVAAVNDAPTATITLPPIARVGGEILVNTITAGLQAEPTITSLASGGFVVVWTDFSSQGADTSDSGIKAQIFDADGAKVGGEFLVNTEIANSQRLSAITSLALGGFVISWSDLSGQGDDASSFGVKAQIFDAGGVKVGAEFLVNTATNQQQNFPTLTSLASGGFVASWSDQSGEGGDANGSGVKAQIFDAAGVKLGTEFLVNTTTASFQSNPKVTTLAAGGFVVSWTDSSSQGADTSSTGIKAQIFDATGVRIGGEFLINTVTVGAQTGQTITALASGGFVVSWTDQSAVGGDTEYGVKAQIFDAAGAKVGGEFLVNTVTAGLQGSPTITSLAPGGFVVSWRDESGVGGDASISGIKAQVFDAAGVKVGSEFLVNTVTLNRQNSQTITALPSGGFVVSWMDESGQGGDADNYGIKAQVFAPIGFQATEQSTLDLKGSLAVADVDAGTGAVTATLSASYGVLTVAAGTSGATVAGSGTGAVTLTGTIAQINALLSTDTTSSISYMANTDAPPARATLTLGVDDGGNTGPGGVLTGSDSDVIVITTVNDAPAGADGSAQVLDDATRTFAVADFGFGDVDGNGFKSVQIATLPFSGTLALNGTPIAAGAEITAAQLAGGQLTFTPAAGSGGTAPSFTFQVRDDGGTANGGIDLDQTPNTFTLNVVAPDVPPTAVADTATTAENVVAAGIAVVSNDTDTDGGPKRVVTLNGVTATVGQAVTLASGATATLNADGTIGYDPNGKFAYLVSSTTAAGNPAYASSATDSFGYALNGGSSATVTVTVTGVDGAGDELRGTPGADAINGTAGADLINISSGGSDTVDAGDSNDGIYVGAAFDAGDRIDGGAGTLDQIGLQGAYGARVTLAADAIRNVEMLVFLAGSDTRFGETGTIVSAFDIKTDDANVAAGRTLIIQANALRAGENLTFDGSAETDGQFLTYGGLGAEVLTGGQRDDGFFFGQGRFGAADRVDGQGGTMDQIGLQGDYSGSNALTFGAAQIVGIEGIVLLSGADTRFGGGGLSFGYTLTMNDANVAAGGTMLIQANSLRSGEVLTLIANQESDATYTVFGGAGDDYFVTGSGADRLVGAGGNDALYGAGGADILTGGTGDDVFIYASGDSTAAVRDRITDLTHGDLIDLVQIPVSSFIGTAEFSNAGQVRVAFTGTSWLVEGDVNGDGDADLSIEVAQASDFVWTRADFRFRAPSGAGDEAGPSIDVIRPSEFIGLNPEFRFDYLGADTLAPIA